MIMILHLADVCVQHRLTRAHLLRVWSAASTGFESVRHTLFDSLARLAPLLMTCSQHDLMAVLFDVWQGLTSLNFSLKMIMSDIIM